jgi:oligopeptide/dipeptide ABC transporter ATP-binding protein
MPSDSKQEILVEAKDLHKYFPVKEFSGVFGKQRQLKAVNGVSLDIKRGEVLGLVGESGCGKSTLGRLILSLLPLTSGSISFDGDQISSLSENEIRPFRKRMQIIFQDPFASLNPRMTVGAIIGEALKVHNICERHERGVQIAELLETVGLHTNAMNKYPHEFSGGQRQRIGIARALAVRPTFIVADEPVSALDVSIQAQIINLLKSLRDQFQLTYLFISHDLDLVEFICDRVAIMYLGQVMELLPAPGLHGSVMHPYSKALVNSIPSADPRIHHENRQILEGDVPSPIDPPSGCPFHTRCPIAEESCKTKQPSLRQLNDGHFVACDLV